MKINFLNCRILFFVLVAGLILSACSKDEEETPGSLIVGTWTAGNSTYTIKIGARTLTQYFTEVLGLSATEAQLYTSYFNQGIQESISGTIQIKSDGSYTANLGGETDTGTWSLSSDGKKLTIDSSQDTPVTFDIIELTANKLRFNMIESINEDLNDDNVPETITVSIEMVFTK